mmetsp:Transcript_34435/g.32808  ORF Transcript_34435/g.32808 Transcript_34435/m.32808 type:complete len:178 (+) Transcript_34435:186-719(+)
MELTAVVNDITEGSGKKTNPWLSISNALIANKCWLCNSTFQRGYKKKVFMISDLVICLVKCREDSLSSSSTEGINKFESKNLQECYDTFVTELNGDTTKLSAELLKYDVANWLSGLVCCRTTICSQEYAILMPSSNNIIAAAAREESLKKNKSSFVNANGVFCPPDCGCDNPWPFLG